VHEVHGLDETLGLEMRLVVGVGVDLEGGDFEVSVGREVFEGLAEDMVVVTDKAFELAAVDIVEVFAVGPRLFVVVDLEAAVGGDPGGLDGAQVVSWFF